jgi:hypothetical protein
MADLCLTDTVNSTKPLLQTIWIPGQVVIHHQMPALQVYAFARRVGGNQNFDIFVLGKGVLRFLSVFSSHLAMNRHNRFGTSDERLNLRDEIIQRVAMLSENDQLAPMTMSIERNWLLVGKGRPRHSRACN